jgi:hypothetical protein
MAMIGGSITIDPGTGADSGTGLSYELFTDLDAKVDFGPLTGAELATAKQQLADLCQSIGTVVVAHVAANAKAKVTTSSTGLQRLPAAPLDEDKDCKAPSATKYLAIE